MIGSNPLPPEMIPAEDFFDKLQTLLDFAAQSTPETGVKPLPERLLAALKDTAAEAREQVAAKRRAVDDLAVAREAHARALEQANNEHSAKLAAERRAAEEELAARGVTTSERESAVVERERALDRRTANLDAREAQIHRRLRAMQEAAAA
jgi:hypothetical protein